MDIKRPSNNQKHRYYTAFRTNTLALLHTVNNPPHNKNVLGQNFQFVIALGRAIFWRKFWDFNKNVQFNKKVPWINLNSERAGVFPKVLSMHKFVDTNLLTQFFSSKWNLDVGGQYSFVPSKLNLLIHNFLSSIVIYATTPTLPLGTFALPPKHYRKKWTNFLHPQKLIAGLTRGGKLDQFFLNCIGVKNRLKIT